MNDFDKFERDLLKMASDFKNGKDAKAFLKKEAKKLNKVQKAKAAEVTRISKKNDPEHFHIGEAKNWKAGKAVKGQGGYFVKAYTIARHANPLNFGHIVRNEKGGPELGFVKGLHFKEAAENEFKEQYYDDTQKFIDDVLDKGLS